MGRRRIWLTAVGLILVATAASASLLQGGQQSSRQKKTGLAPTMLAPSGGAVSARPATGKGSARSGDAPVISFEVQPGVPLNADLRTLPAIPPDPLPVRPELELPAPPATKTPPAGVVIPKTPLPANPTIPAPAQNFDGADFAAVGAGYPPDTVGDVGPNHYIEAVNTGFRIFNKVGATLVTSTFAGLWAGAGTGTSCDTSHFGDPTVVYDPIGNRWIVADFSWANVDNGPYFECIAVSQTADPVGGGWFRYAIRTDDVNHPWLADYPKMGIWPNGLFMSANMFNCTNSCGAGTTFNGVRVWAFERADLEAGVPVTTIVSDAAGTNEFTLLPGNLRGAQPPVGRDEFFVGESTTAFNWQVWKFHADFVTPVNSTFTGPTVVSQAAYGCCTFPRVTTPGNPLDSLADRAMMQLQYRNILGTESLWATHTVPTANATLPELTQWAQINVTGGNAAAAPVQQQIWNPADTVSRWMAALAVDRQGNMALGYSAANAGTNPQVRYTGRLVGDPLGTLPQGEGTFIAGTGSQTNTCGGATCTRWGDYSAMSVDPADDCTFWYVGEYYAAASGSNWRTRIGSFKFTQCNPPTAATVRSFNTVRGKQGVAVTWRTASEARIVGFNVFRNGVKVNRSLIAAKRSGQPAGAAYRLVDRKAPRLATYRIQVVDLNGARSWYGIGSAAPIA